MYTYIAVGRVSFLCQAEVTYVMIHLLKSPATMINLKPRQNRSMRILDQDVRSRVAEVVRHLLEPI